MGIGGLAKSVGKKALGAAKGIGSSLLGHSYSAGVLNDFSVVEKATFTLIQLGDINNPDSVDFSETIPVQINPSDLVFQYSSPASYVAAGLNDLGGTMSSETYHEGESSLSVTLYYDFYDEYNARSASGALGFLESFHLMNKKFSSLERLILFTQEQKNPHVLFRWGDINFYGVIESLSPAYRAFSQWGQPLKAEVSVTIQGDNSKSHESIKNGAMQSAAAKGMFKKVENAGMLLTGLAMR